MCKVDHGGFADELLAERVRAELAEAARLREEAEAMLKQAEADRASAAEERITASRDSAMGALRSVAADTAEALVTRLTGLADRAAVEQAVGAELAARGRA